MHLINRAFACDKPSLPHLLNRAPRIR